MTEEWREIPWSEGRYRISDMGRVKSMARRVDSVIRKRWLKERILMASPDRHGYPRVNLRIDGEDNYRYVHQLVARAFIGPPPGDGYEVCHNDGDRANPAAVNLRWGTRSENNLDQVRHGTHPHAFKTHCPRGHEYTPDNTYAQRDRRQCRTCRRELENARRRVARVA